VNSQKPFSEIELTFSGDLLALAIKTLPLSEGVRHAALLLEMSNLLLG
jgi:hypothetical protein